VNFSPIGIAHATVGMRTVPTSRDLVDGHADDSLELIRRPSAGGDLPTPACFST
jgi:hypothetical protein